jgi:hypothetical protein
LAAERDALVCECRDVFFGAVSVSGRALVVGVGTAVGVVDFFFAALFLASLAARASRALMSSATAAAWDFEGGVLLGVSGPDASNRAAMTRTTATPAMTKGSPFPLALGVGSCG